MPWGAPPVARRVSANPISEDPQRPRDKGFQHSGAYGPPTWQGCSAFVPALKSSWGKLA